MAVVALGTVGALYATLRIAGSDMAALTRHPRWLTTATMILVGLAGVGCILLYHAMGAAE